MDQERIAININISIRQPYMGGSGLQLSDSFEISSRSFIEMAKILGQFEDLAKTIKQEK